MTINLSRLFAHWVQQYFAYAVLPDRLFQPPQPHKSEPLLGLFGGAKKDSHSLTHGTALAPFTPLIQ